LALTLPGRVDDFHRPHRKPQRNPLARWTNGVVLDVPSGMLNAEESFRRVKRHKQMHQLFAALHRPAHLETSTDSESVGTAA
jgi:hypothetical protein